MESTDNPTASQLWHRLRQKMLFASSPPADINADDVHEAARLLGMEFVEREKPNYAGKKR